MERARIIQLTGLLLLSLLLGWGAVSLFSGSEEQKQAETGSRQIPNPFVGGQDLAQGSTRSGERLPAELAARVGKVEISLSELKRWERGWEAARLEGGARQALAQLIYLEWRRQAFRARKLSPPPNPLPQISARLGHLPFLTPAERADISTLYSLDLSAFTGGKLPQAELTARPVTRAEAEAFVRRNRRLYEQPERIELQAVALGDRKQAKKLVERLRRGQSVSRASRGLAGLFGSLDQLALSEVYSRRELPPTLSRLAFQPGAARGWRGPAQVENKGGRAVYYVYRVGKRFPANRLKGGKLKQAISQAGAQLQGNRNLRAIQSGSYRFYARMRASTLCGRVRIELCRNGPALPQDLDAQSNPDLIQ